MYATWFFFVFLFSVLPLPACFHQMPLGTVSQPKFVLLISPSFAFFCLFGSWSPLVTAGHRWSPLAGHRRQCRAVHLPFSTDDEDEEDEGGAIAEERMLLLLLPPPPLLLLSLPPSRLPGGPPPPPPATEDPRKEEDEPEACIASSTSSEK